MRACVCVRVLCVNRKELALPPANQCPLEGMWNLRQRAKATPRERKTVCEREREEALGKQILLSSPSSNLRFFTRRLKHLGENILLEEISEDGELKL